MKHFVLELQFRRLSLAYVTSDAVHADNFSRCATHGVEALVDPDLRAILAHELDIDGRLDMARKHPRQPEVTSVGVHQAVDELGLRVELVRRVPGDRERCRAHELEGGIGEIR